MSERRVKSIWKAALAGLLVFTAACSQQEQQPDDHPTPYSGGEGEVPVIEAGIYDISKYGNIILTIKPDAMIGYGYEEADIIDVEIGGKHMKMPIGTNYSDVDAGRPVCRYDLENDPPYTTLAIASGNLATTMEVADKNETDDEKGYEWIYREGKDKDMAVTITMFEKQGYADEYAVHKVTATRTNERSDYPDLTDQEFCNFRVVETTGMGKGTLYRSSSPVNPKIGRNKEADEALSLNGVKTVINLADYEKEMKEFPDYSSSYYSRCEIIPLAMSMDITAEDNRKKLAEGLRFIAGHEGPYLIHCLEGKDRTGFICGVLEGLMGADLDEIVDDYMITYYNFYNVEKGAETYDRISAIIIHQILDAFKISSYTKLGEDEPLTPYAEKYILGLGLSEEELQNLKDRLAADWGGQN